MSSVVRAAALRGLPQLVHGLGGDADGLFARARVPVDSLDNDDALVPSRTAGRLLETAASELHRPDLGLRLAAQQDIGVLGPLSIAVENSATLGDALDCATRFLFAHSPGSRVAQVPDPQSAPGVVGLLYENADPMPAQAVDHALGLFHRVIVLLHGGSYGLRSAHLPHPPLAPVSSYTDHFGADVRFAQPGALLRVPTRLLTTALPGADPVLREITLDYIAAHFTEPARSTSDQVRLLLARSLGSAPIHLAAIARLLTVHPRTLQRRLAAESTSFDALLDDVRRTTAHRLITETDLPFSQVTAMVGLTGQSALTRAVRRWSGRAPRDLRQQRPVAAAPGVSGGADA
ncbi:AraC family transcriptional regulator [Pseudonocardia sp. MH-G8]|uniref:AraC family transcriptional regulator n=1 Tax=Pseudonocardia sp. MH-G8 TaxID=1854588 RepID=UPI000BA0ADBF|nr:AraC family transcriptional regulator [Pseudonocardia sp. MH-G8]OZM79767.1 AraC family transcriptional regulator [Pseudonocardia sp. MH-G8]